MNWTKASAIAEIVSSIAILATLVYLAIQTQQISAQTSQNTAAILSSSRQQSLSAEQEIFRMALDHPEANVFNTDSQADVGKFVIATSYFRLREFDWLQYQNGLLDAATWQTNSKTLTEFLQGNSELRQFWDTASFGLNPEFVAAINSQLLE